jgi:hypothetical protein
MATIFDGPHYEISSSELASWLEKNAADSWWNVDGDPLLTGRLSFPCPSDELASELRAIGRTLLIQAVHSDTEAKGQSLKADQVSRTVSKFQSNLFTTGRLHGWANDRLFYCCWKDSPHEWLLTEDSVTAKQAEADKMSLAN